MKNLRALHDRVIVKRVAEKTKTASGIVIPESAAEKTDEGEVVGVGPGKLDDKGQRVPLEVKVGNHVLFGKYAGQAHKIDNEEVLFMREEDILAVVIQ